MDREMGKANHIGSLQQDYDNFHIHLSTGILVQMSCEWGDVIFLLHNRDNVSSKTYILMIIYIKTRIMKIPKISQSCSEQKI